MKAKYFKIKYVILFFIVLISASIVNFLHKSRMEGVYGNYNKIYRIQISSYYKSCYLMQMRNDLAPVRILNRKIIIKNDTIISTDLSDSLSFKLFFTNDQYIIVQKFPGHIKGDTLFQIDRFLPYLYINTSGGIWVNGKKERIWTDNYFNFLKVHKKYEKGIVKDVEYEWRFDFKLLDR
jgi:hypothetical protein